MALVADPLGLAGRFQLDEPPVDGPAVHCRGPVAVEAVELGGGGVTPAVRLAAAVEAARDAAGAGKEAVQQHLVDTCSGSPENFLALLQAFIPTVWDVRTGAPITGATIVPFVERHTYDSVAGPIEPQVLIDLLADVYPTIKDPCTHGRSGRGVR